MAFPSPTLNPKVFSTGDQCADNNSQGPHAINLNLSLLRRQLRLSWTSAPAQKNPAIIILPIHKRFLTLSELFSVLFHYTRQGNICPDEQIRCEKMVRKLRLWQLPLLLRETRCLQFQVSIWRKVQRAPMASNIRITSGEKPNANVRIPIWGCSKKSRETKGKFWLRTCGSPPRIVQCQCQNSNMGITARRSGKQSLPRTVRCQCQSSNMGIPA